MARHRRVVEGKREEREWKENLGGGWSEVGRSEEEGGVWEPGREEGGGRREEGRKEEGRSERRMNEEA